ncbi:MAG: hypothetical protein LQ350_001045 [Teloschistes chrysophthalmus]|nr:MAG: hypothetical protein LQ350_001045 [Niorma chrysophthalma]
MKPAARISAFQRERDLVKKAKAALENIPVAALFNIFHEPYPTIQHDEFQGNSKEATTSNDRLSTLPTEIFDLVMMNLSPPALDAARYVCRSWRTKIMTSTIVLRTVLGSQRREKAQASGIEWLRLLRRDFDRQSDLIQCWNHPDVWRTRYRQCDISFLIPPVFDFSDNARFTADHLPTHQLSAHFCMNGGPLGYLVTAARAPSGKLFHSVIIYHFSILGRPCYVGSITYDGDLGAPRIANLSQASYYGDWHFDVLTDENTDSYSIGSSYAIAKGESPFTIRKLGHSLPAEASSLSRETDSPGKELEPLYSMHSTDTLIAVLPGHTNEPKRSLVLAGSGEFGQHDVYLCYTPLAKQYASLPMARLCPPRAEVVLRNIALSSSGHPDGTTTVAILWQEVSTLPKRPELYIYEIPKRIHVSTGSGLHPNVRPNSTYAHSLRQTLNHKQRQLPSNISGKRIRSLDSNAGGVHSASPLWRNPEERTTREHQTNLGGLAILQTDEKVLFPLGTKATHQAVFAWGPGSDQVDLSIFDLSYANHNLEQLPARFYGSTDSTWYKRAAYHLTKHDPQLSGIPYNGILCQCAMHDDGYKVILPNDGRQRTATRAGVESRTIWNLWYGPRVPTAAATEGCVEHYDSPARAKAWARRDEWLQQRIEIMKGVGLSDKEISIAWKEQLWTRSGLFDRPDRRKETKP